MKSRYCQGVVKTLSIQLSIDHLFIGSRVYPNYRGRHHLISRIRNQRIKKYSLFYVKTTIKMCIQWFYANRCRSIGI